MFDLVEVMRDHEDGASLLTMHAFEEGAYRRGWRVEQRGRKAYFHDVGEDAVSVIRMESAKCVQVTREGLYKGLR